MELIGGLVIAVIILAVVAVVARHRRHPAYDVPNEETGISESEWQNAIR